MRDIIFCCDETAACFLIKPVNDTWPFFSADTRPCRAVVQQRVDQSVFAVTRARMDCQARWFIDDDEVVVFVEDLQRNRFGCSFDFFRWRLCEFDFISRSHRLVRSRSCATDTNKAGAN